MSFEGNLMASLQEYCRKLTDEQLLDALREYESSDDPVFTLSAQQIREILLERYLEKIENDL